MKLFFGMVLVLQLGCGVRSDPIPPGQPPFIGKGKPDKLKLYYNKTRDMSPMESQILDSLQEEEESKKKKKAGDETP
ncbi:MAG: hypothetical protein AB8E15_11095 [Bdellovibrionales bacterium]